MWLSLPENTRWLLVYDNYDTPKLAGHAGAGTVDVQQYMSYSDHGSIVITTRSAEVDLGASVHVKKLSKDEDGLAILSYASRRPNLEAGELVLLFSSQYRGKLSGPDPDAIALVRELDGLPLALATAGVYLNQVTTSFAEYLEMYRASWLEVQRSSPQITTYKDRSLYTTWRLSLDQIKRRDGDAAKLLKL